MYSPGEREQLLDDLIARARADETVTAAALVGSAARGELDVWSDIDLALRLRPGSEVEAIADDWARTVATSAPVADQLDVWSGPTLYRVYLLANSLQVDLSFWPADAFASTGEPFELLFGEVAEPVRAVAGPDDSMSTTMVRGVVGWAWLYALHARSAIGRGRWWQAAQMLESLRAQVVILACLRHDLPSHHGRGADRLPTPLRAELAQTLVGELTGPALNDSFRLLATLLLAEIDQLDAGLAERLRPPLRIMADSADSRAVVGNEVVAQRVDEDDRADEGLRPGPEFPRRDGDPQR